MKGVVQSLDGMESMYKYSPKCFRKVHIFESAAIGFINQVAAINWKSVVVES